MERGRGGERRGGGEIFSSRTVCGAAKITELPFLSLLVSFLNPYLLYSLCSFALLFAPPPRPSSLVRSSSERKEATKARRFFSDFDCFPSRCPGCNLARFTPDFPPNFEEPGHLELLRVWKACREKRPGESPTAHAPFACPPTHNHLPGCPIWHGTF